MKLDYLGSGCVVLSSAWSASTPSAGERLTCTINCPISESRHIRCALYGVNNEMKDSSRASLATTATAHKTECFSNQIKDVAATAGGCDSPTYSSCPAVLDNGIRRDLLHITRGDEEEVSCASHHLDSLLWCKT